MEEKMPPIVLHDDNWPTYSKRMTAFLKIKRLDQCIAAPLATTTTEGAAAADEDKKAQDKQAAGYIMCSVSEKFLNMLEEDDTAYKMWTTLKECFNKQDTARWLDYMQRLSFIKKKPEESITDYTGRAQDICASLKNIEKPVAEALAVNYLMVGLPEDYDVWRTILRRSPEEELTFKNFLSIMLEAEQSLSEQGRRVDPSLTSTAMFTRSSGNYSKHKNRGSFGHHQHSGGHQDGRKCYYCGEQGHIQMDCPVMAEDKVAAQRLTERTKGRAGATAHMARAYASLAVPPKKVTEAWFTEAY